MNYAIKKGLPFLSFYYTLYLLTTSYNTLCKKVQGNDGAGKWQYKKGTDMRRRLMVETEEKILFTFFPC